MKSSAPLQVILCQGGSSALTDDDPKQYVFGLGWCICPATLPISVAVSRHILTSVQNSGSTSRILAQSATSLCHSTRGRVVRATELNHNFNS
ncbi:hypothetical protein M405DRAFT_810442 [Rhizopogon salebrosus TDB-379]|nr:hypothetical protein M405DRAFT_810442 [Rhizopogon salebrosus TDB-379]